VNLFESTPEFSYCAAALDLSKSFDLVKRWLAIERLAKIGVETATMTKLLSNTLSCVRVNNNYGSWFGTNMGVVQGDSASPGTFLVYVEAIIRKIVQLWRASNHQHPEIPVEITQFADDTILHGRCKAELISKIDLAKVNFSEEDQKLNEDKTEFISASKEDQSWKEKVVLGAKLGPSEEIHRRLHLADIVFSRISGNFGKLSLVSRILQFKMFVMHIAMYNCGLWSMDKKLENKSTAGSQKRCGHYAESGGQRQ
jgi:hypothetical protein